MELNWNFLEGLGVQTENPSVEGGGGCIFSGTTQSKQDWYIQPRK